MVDEKYDAVLVLGGGINLDGNLPDAMKVQVEGTVDLFELHSAKAFITSGLYGYKAEEKPIISEARAYSSYAETLGIKSSQIHIEEHSQETLGNILFTSDTYYITSLASSR